MRCAVNLARDRLRRRKREPYTGPWLPAPIETGEEAADTEDPERRYGMLESVSFAFLVACEALTPRQRAVLLLRDVLDYSVEETATALGLSLPNVKTTHHRARAAMQRYDSARRAPTRGLQQKTRTALERFAFALSTGDLAAVEAVLAPGAVTTTDAGGDFRAALRHVVGASRVARFYLGLLKKNVPSRVVWRSMNGLPALLIERDNPPIAPPPRLVLRCEVDADHAPHPSLEGRGHAPPARGGGVSVVFDSVGRATFAASLDALKRRGLLVCVGTASGPVPPSIPRSWPGRGPSS